MGFIAAQPLQLNNLAAIIREISTITHTHLYIFTHEHAKLNLPINKTKPPN